MRTLIKFLLVSCCVFLFTHGAFAANDDCEKLLAGDIVNAIFAQDVDAENDTITISSDNLIPFFVANIDVCRDYLLARTEEDDVFEDSDDLIIDLDWDYIVQEVSAALTTSSSSARHMFLCENNRSGQVLVEIGMWIPTIIAAVASFGSGGVVITGVKEGIKQGARNFVKIGVKKGVKKAAVEGVAKRLGTDVVAEKTANKVALTAAEKAVKDAARRANSNVVVSTVKNDLKKNGKRATVAAVKKEITNNGTFTVAEKNAAMGVLNSYSSALGERTAIKKAAVEIATHEAVASATLKKALVTFAISTPIAVAGGIASVYSWLESGFDPKVMNCHGTNRRKGCYLSCTKDLLTAPSDDLNTKVFKRVFGKNLCVDETNNFVLREINNGGMASSGDVFFTTEAKWEEAKKQIIDNVVDKGNCDWKVNDIDMFVGIPLYDESTLMPVNNGATGLIIDGLRLDD